MKRQQGFANVAITVGIAVVLVGALGFVFWQNYMKEDSTASESSTQSNTTEEADKAVQAPIEEATLEAVGNYTGVGAATRVFDTGVFAHAVTAYIDDPAEGKFYEGWLVNGKDFFSTGKLKKNGDTYELSYTAYKNYPDHKLVVITEETLADGLDNKPEAHVLEGSFK